MNADAAAVALVLIAAPAVTCVPILFLIKAWRSWFRTVLGWSLMTSSWGLALLVDISLLYQFFGDDYWLRDVVRLTVYGLIAGGAWLTVAAMVRSYFSPPRS